MWCQAITEHSLIQIHASKNSDCSTLDEFNICVISHFSPYFDDLRECCHKLHRLFFGQTEDKIDVTHDQMIAVLQESLDTLPLEEIQPRVQDKFLAASFCSTTATSRGSDYSKVHREVEDEEDQTMGGEDEESTNNEDEESVSDEDDESEGNDQNSRSEGGGNMIPDHAARNP